MGAPDGHAPTSEEIGCHLRRWCDRPRSLDCIPLAGRASARSRPRRRLAHGWPGRGLGDLGRDHRHPLYDGLVDGNGRCRFHLIAAFATLWFRLTAPVGPESAFATGRSFVVLFLPVLLVAWPLWIWVRNTGTTDSKHLLLAVAYWVSGILLLIGAIRLASIAPSTEVEHHVRLIWTGLDTFELVGLAATAWCIHTCSRWLVLASTFTAALLTADAWTNVASTTGPARTAAIVMAVIEISLGVLSLSVAGKLGPDGSQTRHRPDVAPTIAAAAEEHL
jgi:hypothetical protein